MGFGKLLKTNVIEQFAVHGFSVRENIYKQDPEMQLSSLGLRRNAKQVCGLTNQKFQIMHSTSSRLKSKKTILFVISTQFKMVFLYIHNGMKVHWCTWHGKLHIYKGTKTKYTG